MEEVWKNIKGYEGLYQISNLGRVKSLKRIVTLSDIITIIAIVVYIIFLIGVVVYAFTINILEKIRRYKNKIKRERSDT